MSIKNSLQIPSIRSPQIGRVIGIGALFLGWQALSMATPSQIIPSPATIASLIVTLFSEGILLANLLPTLYRTILAFIGAMTVGIGVGILLGINSLSRKWVIPYLLVGLSISGLSTGAVGILLFGYSILSPIFANTVATFPYIAVNVWKGVESLDTDLLDMSRSFNVSTPRTILRLVLPHTAPSLFSAFRFGLASSWKIVTVVEVFGASNGVGYKLIQNYDVYNFQRAWAWGIIFMIVVLLIEYVIIQPIERKAFEYRPEANLSF